MKKVTVYTSEVCPYCFKAKAMLQANNIEFTEILVEGQARKDLSELTGMYTVPQILFDDEVIGGADDLEVIVNNNTLLSRLED